MPGNNIFDLLTDLAVLTDVEYSALSIGIRDVQNGWKLDLDIF